MQLSNFALGLTSASSLVLQLFVCVIDASIIIHYSADDYINHSYLFFFLCVEKRRLNEYCKCYGANEAFACSVGPKTSLLTKSGEVILALMRFQWCRSSCNSYSKPRLARG